MDTKPSEAVRRSRARFIARRKTGVSRRPMARRRRRASPLDRLAASETRRFHSIDGAACRTRRQLYRRPKAMTRHGRACPGHPRRRAAASQEGKPRIRRLLWKSQVSFTAWMAGTSPAMTAAIVFDDWRWPVDAAQSARELRPELRELRSYGSYGDTSIIAKIAPLRLMARRPTAPNSAAIIPAAKSNDSSWPGQARP